MKQKYGIFAEESGEVRMIHTGSVRFSRANRFALKVFGQGVFFAHYLAGTTTDGEKTITTYTPVGERHKPKHIEKPDWRAVPSRVTDVERDIKYMNQKSVRKFKKAPRPYKHHDKVDYNEVDPQTGESLNDVYVDIIRSRLARGVSDV